MYEIFNNERKVLLYYSESCCERTDDLKKLAYKDKCSYPRHVVIFLASSR